MFTTHLPEPRKFGECTLPENGVPMTAPVEAPGPDNRPLWMRFMPLIIVGMVVAFFAISLAAGRSAWMMVSILPVIGMTAMMYFSHMRGGTGTEDVAAQIEEYDLALRESRAHIHDQGRAMHDLLTLCYPNPADLASLVGTEQMWQADPDTTVGGLATPEAIIQDPRLKNLTANPWLRARVGVGVAPLYPALIPAENLVPEKLEPSTMVRYSQAMNILSVVANLPINANLAGSRAYSMRGEEQARLALARAMLMSLAFNHRPDLLNIGVITNDPQPWEWMKWLPHAEDLTRIESGLGPRPLAWRSVEEFGTWWESLPDGERPHLLVVVDTPDRAVAWPSGAAGGVDGMTWLVVRYGSDLVTEDVNRILIDGDRVSTVRDFDAATRDAASLTEAAAFARAMYRYRPAGYGDSGADQNKTPDHIPDFFEALGIADIETHDLVKVWETNAYTEELRFPVGYSRRGEEVLPELSWLNLYDDNRDGDGPHGVVAGSTGSGKSFFLKAFVLSLVATYGPEKVNLILADFKGGATFIGMEDFPHTVAVLSDLENATELVERLGSVLTGEMDRRKQFFADKKLADIFEYRDQQQKRRGDPDWPPLPDIVVIIDEFGEFLNNNKHYMDTLTSVGRIGRTLGLHLVLCNQRLSTEHLGADLLNNTAFRYSLSVDRTTSTTLLGSDAAEKIVKKKGGLPGKILRRLPSDAVPAEMVALNHEARYTRRGSVKGRRSRTSSGSSEAVVVFELFPDRDFVPVIDGEVVEVVEEKTGDQMGVLLREKVARLRDMKVLDLWKPSLREPVSLSTAAAGIAREHTGLRIRIGDLDAPEKLTRLPWFMDFGGALPHQVIAGSAKSGRTTLLQTLVIAGCLQHSPQRLSFLLADFGAGKLGEVKHSPNVAAYAAPGDADTVERMLGEIRRLIALRRREMVAREVSTVDAYLASKTVNPVPGDEHGYVIFAIDGIGGFLGEETVTGESPRAGRAALLRPILDQGAAVGVHLVFTADSMSTDSRGNCAHYSTVIPGGVQLPASSYTSAVGFGDKRGELEKLIPANQPGRSFDPATQLQSRTLVPINRAIEPDHSEDGAPVFPVTDYGAEIRELTGKLTEAFAGQTTTPVLPAASRIDFSVIWSQFAPLVDPQRSPQRTLLPVGVDIGSLELSVVPNRSQNLLVYGQKGSGKTNALRVIMESVMRQFTPQQANIIVIDPQRQLLGLRDRLYASGFVARASAGTVQPDGSLDGAAPSGYVTSDEDIEDTVAMLAALMASRAPSDDATVEQLQDRTYFSGREVYVFVDNFSRLTDGMLGRSKFDEDIDGGESVTRLLSSGDDLGVHFIVADDTGFAERVTSAPFLVALRDKQMAPILQLAAPPSSGAPIKQAYHLKPSNGRPGRGRLIVDTAEFYPVQTAYLDPAGMTLGDPTRS